MGVPISQWCPNGSVMRPSRQPCSSPTGEVTVAPAAKAALTMLSGSPVTSRVRLVPPSIAAALNRALFGVGAGHPEAGVADSQLRDGVLTLSDLVNDRRAESGLVERDRLRGRSTRSWGWMSLTAAPGYLRFLARFRARCQQGRRIAQPEACLLGKAA